MDKILRFLGKQDWIRFGIRDRLIRKYCNPDTASYKEFETNFFSLKYKGNLNSYIDWCVYFYGAYEKEYLFLYRDIIRNKTKPVFLDIGANVGHHSLFMSLLCSEVHAFEPNPLVRTKLEEKITINNTKNIFVHGVGLGQKDENLSFYAPEGSNQGTGSFISTHSNKNKKYAELTVVSADNYISKLELKKIDLIKIDVEGFEKNVLQGLRETIDRYRPTIIVEFSSTTQESFSDVNELMGLFPENYKINKISSRQPYFTFFNSKKCKKIDFDFNTSGGDILCSPVDVM